MNAKQFLVPQLLLLRVATAQKHPAEGTETAECHEPPVFRAKAGNSVTSRVLGLAEGELAVFVDA
jgi:hypothetical protein